MTLANNTAVKCATQACSIWRGAIALGAMVLLSIPALVMADSLDDGVNEDAFLLPLVGALAEHEIDVTTNLNSRDVVKQRIRRPRLGRFPDLPIDTLVTSEEVASWESAYVESQLGGIAILVNENSKLAPDAFTQRWLQSPSDQRMFITFYADDLSAANRLAETISLNGHAVNMAFDVDRLGEAGQLYATAAQRLAIDSRAARRYRTEVTEIQYLGKRVRRRSNSLFVEDGNRGNSALARREPSVFLKETLGDEFNQSTIEAIIVPGGVALGESARTNFVPQELIFSDQQLTLIDEAGENWALPEIDLRDAKALFDFVNRSEAIGSDAIVDIDADGRVRISSALRDTDAGYAIMHADTQPFEFVPNLPVTKSVVIDTGVNWRQLASGEPLQFDVDFEVRFLSADIMRIAQTRVALEYHFDSAIKFIEYSDSWGGYKGRLDENLDFSGLGSSMVEVATYAGWVSLFRRLQEDDVRFLRGRYDFLKVDKTGQKTPIRY